MIGSRGSAGLAFCFLGALSAPGQQPEAALKSYLQHTYPCQIRRVAVEAEQIRVEGALGAQTGELWLAEVPVEAEVAMGHGVVPLQSIVPAEHGTFSVVFPKSGHALSAWAVARKTEGGMELLSHAHYADDVRPALDSPEEKARGRKGLGGYTAGRIPGELDALGISSITVNITLDSLLSLEAGPERAPFEYAGQTWYVANGAQAGLDRTIEEARAHHLIVSAIILVPKPGPPGSYAERVAFPGVKEGIFALPNVVTKEGVAAYGAALEYLAERYSRPPFAHGRIHHWIMHNEVNSGWMWANAGPQSDLSYTELLTKSLRTAQTLLLQQDAHARVFVSLDHHWTDSMGPKGYPGRRILELLEDFTAAEGDFPWGLAYHPYPQDLGDPRVWNNPQAEAGEATPKITFRNLEVLAAWMNQPRQLYHGRERRPIHLTEQGLNSPDYTELSLRRQAAGMAYAWKKMERLPEITEFDYHNWVDNRAEGGLRIGLRKFPDEPGDTLGKKPIWFVYQALETPGESAACEFAKTLIGIGDWAQIMQKSLIH